VFVGGVGTKAKAGNIATLETPTKA